MLARISKACNPEPVYNNSAWFQACPCPPSSLCRAQEHAKKAALTFTRDVRGHLGQHSLQVCQRIPEGKPPAGRFALAQVVCMLQADTTPGAAVALQAADVQVQVANGALCLILLLWFKALGGCDPASLPHPCMQKQA